MAKLAFLIAIILSIFFSVKNILADDERLDVQAPLIDIQAEMLDRFISVNLTKQSSNQDAELIKLLQTQAKEIDTLAWSDYFTLTLLKGKREALYELLREIVNRLKVDGDPEWVNFSIHPSSVPFVRTFDSVPGEFYKVTDSKKEVPGIEISLGFFDLVDDVDELATEIARAMSRINPNKYVFKDDSPEMNQFLESIPDMDQYNGRRRQQVYEEFLTLERMVSAGFNPWGYHRLEEKRIDYARKRLSERARDKIVKVFKKEKKSGYGQLLFPELSRELRKTIVKFYIWNKKQKAKLSTILEKRTAFPAEIKKLKKRLYLYTSILNKRNIPRHLFGALIAYSAMIATGLTDATYLNMLFHQLNGSLESMGGVMGWTWDKIKIMASGVASMASYVSDTIVSLWNASSGFIGGALTSAYSASPSGTKETLAIIALGAATYHWSDTLWTILSGVGRGCKVAACGIAGASVSTVKGTGSLLKDLKDMVFDLSKSSYDAITGLATSSAKWCKSKSCEVLDYPVSIVKEAFSFFIEIAKSAYLVWSSDVDDQKKKKKFSPIDTEAKTSNVIELDISDGVDAFRELINSYTDKYHTLTRAERVFSEHKLLRLIKELSSPDYQLTSDELKYLKPHSSKLIFIVGSLGFNMTHSLMQIFRVQTLISLDSFKDDKGRTLFPSNECSVEVVLQLIAYLLDNDLDKNNFKDWSSILKFLSRYDRLRDGLREIFYSNYPKLLEIIFTQLPDGDSKWGLALLNEISRDHDVGLKMHNTQLNIDVWYYNNLELRKVFDNPTYTFEQKIELWKYLKANMSSIRYRFLYPRYFLSNWLNLGATQTSKSTNLLSQVNGLLYSQAESHSSDWGEFEYYMGSLDLDTRHKGYIEIALRHPEWVASFETASSIHHEIVNQEISSRDKIKIIKMYIENYPQVLFIYFENIKNGTYISAQSITPYFLKLFYDLQNGVWKKSRFDIYGMFIDKALELKKILLDLGKAKEFDVFKSSVYEYFLKIDIIKNPLIYSDAFIKKLNLLFDLNPIEKENELSFERFKGELRQKSDKLTEKDEADFLKEEFNYKLRVLSYLAQTKGESFDTLTLVSKIDWLISQQEEAYLLHAKILFENNFQRIINHLIHEKKGDDGLWKAFHRQISFFLDENKKQLFGSAIRGLMLRSFWQLIKASNYDLAVRMAAFPLIAQYRLSTKSISDLFFNSKEILKNRVSYSADDLFKEIIVQFKSITIISKFIDNELLPRKVPMERYSGLFYKLVYEHPELLKSQEDFDAFLSQEYFWPQLKDWNGDNAGDLEQAFIPVMKDLVKKYPKVWRYEPAACERLHNVLFKFLDRPENAHLKPKTHDEKLKLWRRMTDRGVTSTTDLYFMSIYNSAFAKEQHELQDMDHEGRLLDSQIKSHLLKGKLKRMPEYLQLLHEEVEAKRKPLLEKAIKAIKQSFPEYGFHYKDALETLARDIRATEEESAYIHNEKYPKGGDRAEDLGIGVLDGILNHTVTKWSKEDQWNLILYLRGDIEVTPKIEQAFKTIGPLRVQRMFQVAPIDARAISLEVFLSNADGLLPNVKLGSGYTHKIINHILSSKSEYRDIGMQLLEAYLYALEKTGSDKHQSFVLSYLLAMPNEERSLGHVLKGIFERFGTTGVKIGQIVAALEILSPEDTEVLLDLQDKAKEPKVEEIYRDIKKILGVDKLSFRNLGLLGAASIKYTIKALDQNTRTEVVLKILRESATNTTPEEFRMLDFMSDYLIKNYGAKFALFKTIIRASKHAVEQELQLDKEVARSKMAKTEVYVGDKVAPIDAADKIKIKAPIDIYVKPRLIVAEFASGTTIKAIQKQSVDDADRYAKKILETEKRILFQPLQSKDSKFKFDRDRHAGNSLIDLEADALTEIDMGQLNEMSKEKRDQFVEIFILSQVFKEFGPTEWGIERLRLLFNHSPKDSARLWKSMKVFFPSTGTHKVRAYFSLLAALDQAGLGLDPVFYDYLLAVMQSKQYLKYLKDKSYPTAIDELERFVLSMKSEFLKGFNLRPAEKVRALVHQVRQKGFTNGCEFLLKLQRENQSIGVK